MRRGELPTPQAVGLMLMESGKCTPGTARSMMERYAEAHPDKPDIGSGEATLLTSLRSFSLGQ